MISLELVSEAFLDIFEVLPGALRSNLETAFRISGPTVEASVVEVVRVCIMDLLHPVVARSKEPMLALESLRIASALHVVCHDVPRGVDGNKVKQGEQWNGHVVLSHLSDYEVPLECSLENVRVGWLGKVELVVSR